VLPNGPGPLGGLRPGPGGSDDRWTDEEEPARRLLSARGQPQSARCVRALAATARRRPAVRQAGGPRLDRGGVGLAATGAAHTAGSGLAGSSPGSLTLARVGWAAALAWCGTS
jgi:hypothetical protein